MTPPVALVLPELSPDAATHYAHYVGLIRELSRLTRVALVVERAEMGVEAQLAGLLPGVEVRVQRETAPLRRAGELARLLRALRARGYRYAYGSYSPYFGIVGGLTGRASGMRTSYWHCRSDFSDRRVTRRLATLLSLHLSSQLVTGTPGLADLYARTFRLPRQRVKVVPNEIDPEAFRPEGEHADTGTVLFVGRLSELKGARLLPDIARAVLAAAPGARVVIAGGGADEQRVAAELAGQERVSLLGYVPNPEVPALMHAADVLVMPSLEEGFPRRLLEAMAAGLPFVAADVGGVREVIPDPAQDCVVPPGSPEPFVAAVVALLGDAERRAALVRAGREHVQRYAVERVAPLFLDAVTS